MIRTRTTRASRAMVLALLASAAAASVAGADTYTWSGKGDAPTWDDNPFMSPEIGYANWSPLGSHLPGSGDDVIFGTGFVSGNPNLNGSRSVNSLTIDSSSSFSIVGNPGDSLAIFSGNLTRTAASSGTQTIAVDLLPEVGSQTPVNFALDGTGSVVLSGGFFIDSGLSTTKSGTADLVVTGAPGSMYSSLNVTGGNFIVDGTTLTIGLVQSFQVVNPGSSIQVNNGGIINTQGNGLVSNGAVLSLTGAGSQLNYTQGLPGALTVGSGSSGTINISQGAAISYGTMVLGQNDGGVGIFNVTGGATASLGGVGIANQGNSVGTINVSGTGSSVTGDFTLSSAQGLGAATVNINDGAVVNGRVRLNSPNALININGGTLSVASVVGNTGTINLQADPAGGHALVFSSGITLSFGTFAGTITGPGSVMLYGPPSQPIGARRLLQLEGTNTYTGATVVQNSDLQLLLGSNNSSFYDAQTAGKIEFGLPGNPEVINLSTGTILSETGGEADYQNVTLNGGLIRGPGKNTITDYGNVVFNGTTIGADATVSTAVGLATPTFNQVTVAGNLMLNSPLNINASIIASSGRVDVNTGSNVTAALLTSNGSLSIHSGGSVTNTAANLTLGSGSITTLDNGGALTLANSTALDLRGGLLTNNGTITGPVNVYFGSVAKGNGTYSGTLNVFEGGRVSPGNSPGTLTSTASAWNQGGIYHWDIADLSGPAGAAWDLWNAGTTSITPTGSFEIEIQSLGSLPGGGLQGWNPSQPYSWLIATADNGAFSAEALSHLAIVDAGFADTNSLAGGSFSLTDSPDGNNLYMTFSPAPEPASFACIALFGSGMLLRRKRRGCA